MTNSEARKRAQAAASQVQGAAEVGADAPVTVVDVTRLASELREDGSGFNLAVADLLDGLAYHHPTEGNGWDPVTHEYGAIDPACNGCGTPDEYAVPWPCKTFDKAAAVVRAWRGEAT